MLSSRAKYATRALLDLTIHEAEGPVQIQEIGERQNIPAKFLEQILLALKRQGWVQSRKGPGGGYYLAVPPHQITLGAVVRVLDGPLAPISCVSATGYMQCGCPDPETCGLRVAWKEARDALADVLDGTTFADIRDRQASLTADREGVLDYII
jgi:Rrf2 family transcriptional regulator, cysteine metabolism repressor